MINFAKNLVWDFEKDSDRRIAAICRGVTMLNIFVILLNVLHIFKISSALYPTLIVSAIILLMPTLLYDIWDLHSKVIRYFVLTFLVFMSGLMYSILSYHVIIMLVLPVVVSCLYCERANVIYTTVLSVPVMIVSHLLAYMLKIVPDEPLVTLRGVVLYGITPRVIELVAISLICINITGKLQRLIAALVNKNNELYEEQRIIVGSLSELVENQSHETGRHVKRVAAYTEILSQAGRQFDPRITKLFDDHFDEFLAVMEKYPDES